MAFLRCKESFSREIPGHGEVVVRVGDIVRDTDPVAKGCEAYFESLEAAVRTFGKPEKKVEQATANPGERRDFSKNPRQQRR